MIKNFGNQEKCLETELTFYRYGLAYFTGLSNRICRQQAAPVFKTKRRYQTGEFISDRFRQTGQMTNWKIINMRKKGKNAYSKNSFSGSTNAKRFS